MRTVARCRAAEALASVILVRSDVREVSVRLSWMHLPNRWQGSWTRPTVASVLLGARTVDQLRDNLAATTIDLTNSSAPGLPPYPYAMIEEFCDVSHWKQLGTEPARMD